MQRTALRTLLADDEPVAREVLREELEEFGDVTVVGEAANGRAALEQIEALQPDLVLLDVQMPGMDGFEVIRRLEGPLPPAVIFVTAYNEYAIRAFEVGAIDYLLKPVSGERLKTAIERARQLSRNPRPMAEGIARLLNADEAQPQGRLNKVVGRSGKAFYLLNLDEVLAFQADGEIVWIITKDRRFMATQTLQALEERLKGLQFRRVHRKALVNVDKIRKMTSLSSQRWLLTLTNGMEITVSKRQAHMVRQVLQG